MAPAMNGFLRSMRGEAGPRVARGAIKSLRNFSTVAFIAWLALSVTVGSLIGPGGAHEHGWLLGVILAPLLFAPLAKSVCEIQIRHLNDLALAPWENAPMDMAGVRRMWIAIAMIYAGCALLVIAAMAQPDGLLLNIWLAIATTLGVGGFIVSPRILLGIGVNRFGPRYDPDEDEWTLGFGKWWY